MSADIQIESSNRTRSGTTSNDERDRVDGGQQDREHEHRHVADAPIPAQLRRAEHAEPDEGEDEDRHLEGETGREQRQVTNERK